MLEETVIVEDNMNFWNTVHHQLMKNWVNFLVA